jgi:transcriptional regulator with XRE-family HTH domain
MDVRELLEDALSKVGGSQADLARRLGVSQATVSRWQSDQVRPDEWSCIRLAALTGKRADEVLEACGYDPTPLRQAVVAGEPPDKSLAERQEIVRQITPEDWPHAARALLGYISPKARSSVRNRGRQVVRDNAEMVWGHGAKPVRRPAGRLALRAA